ncbi:speckle-type POZ protein-like protein [Fusarium bulbicola]|nr:speckle-type POZ protein-like protein [Fusarium bulbicola]
MRPQPYSFLLKSVVSGEFSDFSLTCNDHDFKLHQVVVCPQSPVLKAALLGGFKETTSKVVAVNEFDVTAVRSMVTFLYTGDYDPRTDKLQMPLQSDDDGKNEEAEIRDIQGDSMSEDSEASGPERERTTEDILFHLRVNAIADYYKIEKLVKVSTAKISTIFGIEQDFRIFPTVIQEMSVSNRDTDLESIIASAMSNCVEELTASQLLRTLDLENSLAVEIIEACGKRIQKLEVELSDAYGLMNSYKSLRDNQVEHNTATLAKIEALIALLKNRSKCRHCSKDFGCYIAEESPLFGQGSVYMLRCEGSPPYVGAVQGDDETLKVFQRGDDKVQELVCDAVAWIAGCKPVVR